ncbi:UNVERIFIED_CONTAM: hypothetical protein RMT77_016536 [Armadillidium vulgare]
MELNWLKILLILGLFICLIEDTVGEISDAISDKKSKRPFEAVFQGLCRSNELCEQLCFDLHDGTFECDCRPGFVLDPNGYSCSKQNVSQGEGSLLYKKETSFIAVLDDEENEDDYQNDDVTSDVTGKQRFSKNLERDRNYDDGDSIYFDDDEEEEEEEEKFQRKFLQRKAFLYSKTDGPIRGKLAMTSPEPNLEQKVPSQSPNIEATQSLTPPCRLDCDSGKCAMDKHFLVPRCQCPLEKSGHGCQPAPRISSGRFHGTSWAAFPALREAYRDVQLSLEFRPFSPEGVLLLSGESDDLSGDFMAAVLKDGYVHFKWDCGSGAGTVTSPEKVNLREWNRITVYRHRWDVWLLLNNGHHVQGRSEGLFSRITFREPLYVGGTYNMTSLSDRLGVKSGFEGCIRRLQVNDHVYKFYKQAETRGVENVASPDYAAVDGWDITECAGELCSEMECLHGGKCITSLSKSSNASLGDFDPSTKNPSAFEISSSSTGRTPVCLCPLGYTGANCEKHVNLEVPSFNGSSLLVFPPLGSRSLSWLELELVFRASSTDGVILYAGHRTDGTGDFIALTLSQAHVMVTINLGSGPLTLRSLYPIQPGYWHSVSVSRTGRRTWMYVDDQLPVEGLTPGAFTMLTLAQPLYLGGIPSSLYPPAAIAEKSNFVGCVQKMSISNQPIHLVSGAVSGTNIDSCDHPCSTHPCDNGGICEPQKENFSCRCPLGFNDPHCRSRVVTQVATPSFSGRSFLKYSDNEILKRISGERLHLWLRFRSVLPDGLLLWIGSEDHNEEGSLRPLAGPLLGDSLSLELKNSRVVLRYNLGSGFAVLSYNATGDLDDGEWHVIKLTRFEREAHLSVDEKERAEIISPGDLVQLNVDSPLYLGGREAYRGFQTGYKTPGLNGCLADLILATDYHIDLITQASAGQNIDYC